MKTLTIEKALDKKHMDVREEVGKVKDFPENPSELKALVNALNDEQALTCLSLLETQLAVFLRPRLQGRTVTLQEALSLERKTNIGQAIKDITAKIEGLVQELAKHPEKTAEIVEQQLALLKKKAELEARQEAERAKRAAKRAAEKAAESK